MEFSPQQKHNHVEDGWYFSLKDILFLRSFQHLLLVRPAFSPWYTLKNNSFPWLPRYLHAEVLGVLNQQVLGSLKDPPWNEHCTWSTVVGWVLFWTKALLVDVIRKFLFSWRMLASLRVKSAIILYKKLSPRRLSHFFGWYNWRSPYIRLILFDPGFR